MPRPPNKKFSLKEKIEKLDAAGFNFFSNEGEDSSDEANALHTLPERIQKILNIIRDKPKKSTTMNYLILYDIEKDKVRNLISKFLIKSGCIRIQKSVFLAHTNHKKFDEIKNTLTEINSYYHNKDSIILVPMNVSDARSMKLIGQNVNIDQIIDPPNTIFI